VSAAPVSDLLDVFAGYDGSVVFRGLAEGTDGQPPVLGRIGWIFTGFGALFALWGFVLRAHRAGGEDKLAEIAKTWIVLAGLIGGPFALRAAMEAADAVYDASPGGPRHLAYACAKAAYAMPELSRLFDVLGRNAVAPPAAGAAAQQRAALLNQANDGSVLGYVEAYGVALWDTAAGYSAEAAAGWSSAVRVAALATGLGAAMLKCLLIAATLLPLYFLLLAAAAIVWFMEQLRFFLAVAGAMMLPLFAGMFSLPAGHPGRAAAQGYVLNLVSLALWPVAWAIGHTGTIALYNALIALIAGTSRVPEIATLLQWSAVTGGVPTEAQLQATEAALGNWFMGNLTALLGLLVGALGFVLWVGAVSVLGPVYLHRMLATGANFMAQAAGGVGRQAAVAGRFAASVGPGLTLGGPGWLARGAGAGERLAAAVPAAAVTLGEAAFPGGGASMAGAARGIDDSGGKTGPAMRG